MPSLHSLVIPLLVNAPFLSASFILFLVLVPAFILSSMLCDSSSRYVSASSRCWRTEAPSDSALARFSDTVQGSEAESKLSVVHFYFVG
jgi:hypothetical protein